MDTSPMATEETMRQAKIANRKWAKELFQQETRCKCGNIASTKKRCTCSLKTILKMNPQLMEG